MIKNIKALLLFLCFIFTVILGTSGYYIYYSLLQKSVLNCINNNSLNSTIVIPLKIFLQSILSSFQLFVGGWDVEISQDLREIINKQDLDRGLNFLFIARISAIPIQVFFIKNIAYKILLMISPRIYSSIAYKRWKRLQGKRILLVGNNDENLRLYKTSSTIKTLILSENRTDTSSLIEERIQFYKPQQNNNISDDEAFGNIVSALLDNTLNHKRNSIVLIINTQNDERNLRLCKSAVSIVSKKIDIIKHTSKFDNSRINKNKTYERDLVCMEQKRSIVEKLERVRIIVIGNRKYKELYEALEDASYGTLKYTNYYRMTSVDFSYSHPMTKYLNDKMSLHNGCIPSGLELNVIFVGFGNTNQELFQDFFVTNQYIFKTTNQSIPMLKPIHYYIIDREKNALHSIDLNHSMFRYLFDFIPSLKEGRTIKEDYLELPPIPFDNQSLHLDINSEQFYETINRICKKHYKSINYIIIAFGNDFNNLELAHRLAAKKTEWELEDLHIFVKVRYKHNKSVAEFLNNECCGYTPFGNSEYTIQQLTNNTIENIAYKRKKLTLNTNAIQEHNGKLSDSTINTLYKWYTMHPFMRRSSIYNILALRPKLQLIGMDFVQKGTDPSAHHISQEEYFVLYAKGCKPQRTHDPKLFRGSMYDYDNMTFPKDYTENIPRRNLCVQEHYRWNAFMIKCGFIPPTISKIKNGFVRDYTKQRMHANLCSFNALFDFRRIRASVKHTDEAKEDVIGYDYKLMDEAWFFLNACGYVIYL